MLESCIRYFQLNLDTGVRKLVFTSEFFLFCVFALFMRDSLPLTLLFYVINKAFRIFLKHILCNKQLKLLVSCWDLKRSV